MKLRLLLGSAIFLAGCASSFEFQEPQEILVENRIIVDKGFDQTWEELLDFTSRTFFSISNLERDSGFINLEFSPSPASDFVDCGLVNVVVPSLPANNYQGYEYAGGYVEFSESSGRSQIVATMNILVQSLSSNRTEVSVNARYAMWLAPIPTPTGRIGGTTVSFGTNDAVGQGTGKRLCQSTGAAEELVLDAVRG
jgi:hypothetical protein